MDFPILVLLVSIPLHYWRSNTKRIYHFRITETERKILIEALDRLADRLEDEESLTLAQHLSCELDFLNKEAFLERILLQLENEVRCMNPALKKQKAIYYIAIALLTKAETFEEARKVLYEQWQHTSGEERAFFEMLLQRTEGIRM